MNRDELLWASGLFEGEGCFTLSSKFEYRTRPSARASLTSTDRDVVERFAQAVGFGSVRGPFKQMGHGSKPLYRWSTSGFKRVQALIAMLWFGLGTRRKERARQVLSSCEGGTIRRHCLNGHEANAENTAYSRRGDKMCIKCRREKDQRYRLKKKHQAIALREVI